MDEKVYFVLLVVPVSLSFSACISPVFKMMTKLNAQVITNNIFIKLLIYLTHLSDKS